MKPFEGKSIEEIGMMVFGKSCKLNEEEKEMILEMFEIDQDITERQLIMEDNVNRARYFAEQRIRMRNIITMMSIIGGGALLDNQIYLLNLITYGKEKRKIGLNR